MGHGAELAEAGPGVILRRVKAESTVWRDRSTRARGWAGLSCSALLLFTLLPTPAHAGARVDIDYVDGSTFVEQGKISIFVDLLDDDYNVIPGLSSEKLEVYIDNVLVPGRVEIETAAMAKEWVAVAILMAAHQSYAPLPALPEGDDDDAAEDPSVLKYEREGFAAFARKFEKTNNKLAVFLYDEKGHRTIDDWSEEHDKTAERIANNVKRSTEALQGDVIAPDFYKALKVVVDDKIGNAENLPRRRILLVMSDGKDRNGSRQGQIDKKIKSILSAARIHGVKIYAVGFSLDTTEPLVNLRTLATKSGGIYREIKPSHMDDVPSVLENLGEELQKQYVLRFYPNEDYDGSEKAVKIRLKVETEGGRILEDEYDERVKIGETAFKWGNLFFWVGWILGGLFAIWLLLKIIGMFTNRASAAAAEEEESGGAFKGKLLVTAGPNAGTEYYLTEESTTIGSVGGNTIVIPFAGVSKRHAGVKIDEMRYELTDFGSTNGTLVNGSKISKQFLRDGDLITIGETEIRFSLH
jgi:hypothetical protein